MKIISSTGVYHELHRFTEEEEEEEKDGEIVSLADSYMYRLREYLAT